MSVNNSALELVVNGKLTRVQTLFICMFSCSWHCFHVFPCLAPITWFCYKLWLVDCIICVFYVWPGVIALVLVLQQALHVGIVCYTVLVCGHTVLWDKMHKRIEQHIPCNVQNHGETRCRNYCRKKNRVVLSATVSVTCLATSFPLPGVLHSSMFHAWNLSPSYKGITRAGHMHSLPLSCIV